MSPVERMLHGDQNHLINIMHGVINVEFARWRDKAFVFYYLYQFAGFIVDYHDG